MNSPVRGNRFMLIFIIVPYFIFFFAISALMAFTGVEIDLLNPVFTVLTQIALFILPSGIFLFITKQKILDVLPLKRLSLKNILLIIGITLTAQSIASVLASISNFFFENTVSEFMMEFMEYPFYVSIITVAVTPAICEEFAFRGVILNEYKNVPIKQAALVNGLFFGIMHMNGQQFLYTFLLGAIFTCLVFYTRSIYASMLAHFILNAGQTLLLYVVNFVYSLLGIDLSLETQSIGLDEKIMSLQATLFIAMFIAPVFVILFKYFIDTNKKELQAIDNSVFAEILSDNMPSKQTDTIKPKIVDWAFITTVVIYGIIILITVLFKILKG